jgi:hypothetical protein
MTTGKIARGNKARYVGIWDPDCDSGTLKISVRRLMKSIHGTRDACKIGNEAQRIRRRIGPMVIPGAELDQCDRT